VPEDIIIMKSGTMDFTDPKYASISPLALKLFQVQGVKRVFFGKDHISVAKNKLIEWNNI
jgi:hypothetical protein